MVSATYDPTVVNGAVRMVSLYREQLEALGHEVIIFSLGEEDDTDRQQGIIRSPGLRLGDYGYYLSMGYSRRAQQLLAQMDIVHCHHLFMSVELAHRYARCPIVYTNHTRYDLYTGTYTPLPQPAADAIMRQLWPEFTDLADTVIAPSESVRQLMIQFGVRAPTVVIENGIRLEPFLHPTAPRTKSDFGLDANVCLLIYVGRLSTEKNLDTLLRQFAAAADIVPELHLALVGKGPREADLQQLAGELNMAARVHFLGVVPYTEVGNYLAAADGFVTASTSEVHPLTLIEAMAAGLPIVAVRSPGIADTVESGQTGYLAQSPAGLAAAMAALAANPERRRAMGGEARQASRRFDIRRTAGLTVDLYRRLLAERPDLTREREHGRWLQRSEKWGALLDQLAQLVHAPDATADGKRRSPLRSRHANGEKTDV